MKTFVAGSFIALTLLSGQAQSTKQVQSTEVTSVKAAPPVVVRTEPQSGALDVDPSVKELRITFSKEMLDEGWSYQDVSPSTDHEWVGKPNYAADRRSCVLSMALKPGKTYALWLNNLVPGFFDADQHAALPYLVVFETKAAK